MCTSRWLFPSRTPEAINYSIIFSRKDSSCGYGGNPAQPSVAPGRATTGYAVAPASALVPLLRKLTRLRWPLRAFRIPCPRAVRIPVILPLLLSLNRGLLHLLLSDRPRRAQKPCFPECRAFPCTCAWLPADKCSAHGS